jgi:hypothetical protein
LVVGNFPEVVVEIPLEAEAESLLEVVVSGIPQVGEVAVVQIPAPERAGDRQVMAEGLVVEAAYRLAVAEVA